jgi:hypothetical protein
MVLSDEGFEIIAITQVFVVYLLSTFKESLPALVRDLFTFSSEVIKSFIIV